LHRRLFSFKSTNEDIDFLKEPTGDSAFAGAGERVQFVCTAEENGAGGSNISKSSRSATFDVQILGEDVLTKDIVPSTGS
jgi:hypothetical protein